MDENWEVYISELNGLPASFFLNLAAKPDGNSILRQYVCRLDLNLVAPSEGGLHTEEESGTLLKIEDELNEGLSVSHNGAFVGRVTHGGKRRFFFYLTNADGVEETIKGRLQAFDDYNWSYVVEHDPDWKLFFEILYPGDEEWQIIGNRRLLDRLEEHGDIHHIARRVDHWIHFPDRAAMERFKSEIMALNFKIEQESFGDGEWGLQIYREDCVEFGHISGVTLELYRLAVESGGEYDGWETSVVRN
jgi:uncharacterized protein (TIGR01619 family)